MTASALDRFVVPADTFTRSELYAARGEEPPLATNGHKPARTCDGCGTDMTGRAASARWCSSACRKRAQRRNRTGVARRNGTAADRVAVLHVDDDQADHHDDGRADLDLVRALLDVDGLVAVTVEYANGWSVTLGRT